MCSSVGKINENLGVRAKRVQIDIIVAFRHANCSQTQAYTKFNNYK